MSAALRAGAVQQVCLVIRWAGHGEVDAIRKLCRALGVACRSFHSIGAVRRWLRGDFTFTTQHIAVPVPGLLFRAEATKPASRPRQHDPGGDPPRARRWG